MSVLTDQAQQKLVQLLVDEGLTTRELVEASKAEAQQTNKPLLSILVTNDIVDDELLTHATAHVLGVPYVNLRNSVIDESILGLVPEDLASRFMAVPLAETNNRLAVAMIDADNVQAVDYLANSIERPIKVLSSIYLTSIRLTYRLLMRLPKNLNPTP